MATIRDVARQAGVSISTVSYVLTGERPIGPETRERVMAAVETLGYRANSMARSLKTGRAMILALLIPDILNPFFTVVARGAEDAAREGGYSLILCNTSIDPRREEEYLGLVRSRRADGLIYMAGSSHSHKHLRTLVRQGFPVVVVDEALRDIDAATIFVNNDEGAAQMGRHLATLGHRRVGIIGGPPELSTVEARVGGVLRGLAEQGITVPDECIAYGDYQISGGREAMSRLLSDTCAPTAVFAANDMMALGAIEVARGHGLDVPRDLSVAGFDDIPLAAMVTPTLTSVAQPALEMGRLAVKLLIESLAGHTQPHQHLTLHTELRVRQSTGPPG